MTTARYLLDSDDDGHWYLIPELEHPAFGDYVASEGMGDFPPGVLSLGSHPSTVTFEAPQHFGQPVASLPAADHHARLAAGTKTARCTKCGTQLSACDTCGKPAMCGDAWCAECAPDEPLSPRLAAGTEEG